MGFTTSTDADVYGAYGSLSLENPAHQQRGVQLQHRLAQCIGKHGTNHPLCHALRVEIGKINNMTLSAQSNPSPKALLEKYQNAVASGKSGERLTAKIDQRSQAFLERAAERIEEGKPGAKKRLGMWNKARREAGLTPLSLDAYGYWGAWDYEGGALNNPEMQHTQNRRQRGGSPSGAPQMQRGGNRRTQGQSTSGSQHRRGGPGRRGGPPGGKKLPLAQAYAQCIAQKEDDSECDWIKAKLEASGGSAITNPRRSPSSRAWRRWRSRRKLRKMATRKGRKIKTLKRKLRRQRRKAATPQMAYQVEQAGTSPTMTLEQQSAPSMQHSQNRRLRGVSSDTAANMQLAGILGFGVDHTSLARTNALQILDMGFAGAFGEGDYGDYGDRESRIKARQSRISAWRSKRVKKRQAKKSKRVKRRVDVRHARQEGRKGRRSERQEGREERQSYRQG